MSTTATVRLARHAGNPVFRTRHEFDIVVDGNEVGSLASGEGVDLLVEPGRHSLRLKSSRTFSSPERTFEVEEGQVIGFTCHTQRFLPMIIASSLKHDLWIELKVD